MERGQGDDGRHAGRDRHRHGEDVVDEQRRACHQRRVAAQVVATDQIGPAAARIGEDRLAIRRDHERDENRNDDRDGYQPGEPECEARAPDRGDEQDLFGGVRRRGQRVRREHRQRDELGEAVPFLVEGRDRAPDERAFEKGVHEGAPLDSAGEEL